jgi:hypothetical protein
VWRINFFDEDAIRERRIKRLEKSLSKLGYKSLEISWEDHTGQSPKHNETVRVTRVVLID